MHITAKITLALLTGLTAGLAAEPLLYLDFQTQPGREVPIRLQKLCETNGIDLENVPVATLEEQKLQGAEGSILLIPESESFPAAAIPGLLHYLKSGGSMILTGIDRPFSSPAVKLHNRYVNFEQFQTYLKNNYRGKTFGVLDDAEKFQRHCDANSGKTPATVKRVLINGKPVLKFNSPNFMGWDNWSTKIDEKRFPENTKMLRIEAKGDGKLQAFTVEIKEKDGSRWIASVPLTQQYEVLMLAPEQFRFWNSVPNRGNNGDKVNFDNAADLVFGLSFTHAPGLAHGGNYRYEIRNVEALTEVPNGGGRYPNDLRIEGAAPNYKTYQLPGPSELRMIDGTTISLPGTTVSAIPRMLGAGIGMERPWRFLPLGKAVNQNGGRGYPIWILLHLDREYRNSMIAGFGLPLAEIVKNEALSRQLVKLIDTMRSGCLLAAAGTSEFVADPGSPLRYGAELFLAPPDAVVRASITRSGQKIAGFEKKVGDQKVVAEPFVPTEPGLYHATAELLAPDGKVMDQLTHELRIDDGQPDPAAEFVRVENDNFVCNGKKWYPVGVNFYPIYGVAGLEPADYTTGWGNRKFYDPILVDEAIADTQKAGINMLSVHVSDRLLYDTAMLRDLLARCKKYDMKLNLFLGAASPVGYNDAEVRRVIETAKLKDDSALFCYDIVWEASNFLYNEKNREAYRPEWNQWLVRQYGSADAAKADWKFTPGSNASGLLNPPTTEQLTQDGDHRVYVAAYRRFMDDHCAKLWQRAADALRRHDPNHLITNRAGNINAFDNGLCATAKALDFISPEGYSIRSGAEGEGAIGFATRLADYYSNGKPIVWSEFGNSILSAGAYTPNAVSIDNSRNYYEAFYRRALEAGAQGLTPWWWPGGYRVNENSDFGITNIDGTLRANGLVTRQYAQTITRERNRRPGNIRFDYDRDAQAGGYYTLCFGPGGEAYLNATKQGGMLEIHTPATGKTSADVPIIGVGNVPYTGKNPVKYLNGAFEQPEYRDADGRWQEFRDGAELSARGPLEFRLRIGNTGEVPYAATTGDGGVEVLAVTNQGEFTALLPDGLARLADTTVTLTLPENVSGQVSLRLRARNRALFGEHLQFSVKR